MTGLPERKFSAALHALSLRKVQSALTIALLFGLLASGSGAWAGQFVQFDSGTSKESVQLTGYLARPPGSGPFAAVVLLHGCGGFHSSMIAWADRLAFFGYATLAVDSFGPRGVSANCGGFGEQVADGYAALHYLASKSFIRSSHVAVLGFSMGGGSVLASLEKGLVERLYTERFRSGVAFYPAGCNSSSGIMTAPVLVLTGDADDWTPSAACEAMVAGRSEIGVSRAPGDRSLIELVIYPGAHHGFDLSDLSLVPSRGVTFQGHRIEYNEEATKNSIARVRDFLQRTLAQP